ncbi:MAG: site-specific integrase [Alphaproteobacteria bacterium]|nr:site-specific integrase [Alphaproteobacteria bacterium]
MTQLVPFDAPASPAHGFIEGLEEAADLADAALAPSTRACYGRAFRRFALWAESHGAPSLPATGESVAAWIGLLHKRRLTPARLAVTVAAIAWHHRQAGLPDPTRDERLRLALKGARRRDAARPRRKAHPLLAMDEGGLPGDIHRLVDAVVGRDLVARRDRAVILLGFAGAFRRSELAALTLADLDWTPRGLLVTVRRSKTDQEGRGLRKAISPGSRHCPVAALKEWLDALEMVTGRAVAAGEGGGALPVFTGFARPRVETAADGTTRPIPVPKATAMSDQTVARILKRHAAAAGLDPRRISGHSLRRGFATSAALAGKDLVKIRSLTGHARLDSLGEYVDAVRAFDSAAGEGLL